MSQNLTKTEKINKLLFVYYNNIHCIYKQHE